MQEMLGGDKMLRGLMLLLLLLLLLLMMMMMMMMMMMLMMLLLMTMVMVLLLLLSLLMLPVLGVAGQGDASLLHAVLGRQPQQLPVQRLPPPQAPLPH
jgi:hypothetical protein